MNPLLYQIYLLQIEDYKIDRFWNLLFTKGFYFSRQPLRKKLVWTNKIYLLIVMSIILVALIFFVFWKLSLVAGLVSLALSLFVMPVYFSLAAILISPLDLLVKSRVKDQAKNLISQNKELKIIGIAGSYGKTTLRNLLVSVLGRKYKILSPDGNINTAVGISAWIKNRDTKNADILIIEFGEEYPGDNRKVAEIFPPDLVIVTGVNEAHFERIGSIEKIAETIFEAVRFSKKNAAVFVNKEDKNASNMYQKFTGDKGTTLYQSRAKNISFDEKKFIQTADLDNFGEISTKILGDYIFADIDVVIKIAEKFGLSKAEIKTGIENLEPITHRLQVIKGNEDVVVIDDSYNGNPAGVKSAINLLAKFTNHRKLFLTPGLVETGKMNRDIHEEIGNNLAQVADKVILIRNSATKYIANGLEKAGFKNENIDWFDSAPEAHNSLPKIIKPGDVILFQNDWGDQYL